MSKVSICLRLVYAQSTAFSARERFVDSCGSGGPI